MFQCLGLRVYGSFGGFVADSAFGEFLSKLWRVEGQANGSSGSEFRSPT